MSVSYLGSILWLEHWLWGRGLLEGESGYIRGKEANVLFLFVCLFVSAGRWIDM